MSLSNAVRFRLAWANGAEVDGELIEPHEWRLAVHRAPAWCIDDQMPGWAVSDTITGLQVFYAAERDFAIVCARTRLETSARARGLSVSVLLDTYREQRQREAAA